MRLLLHNQLACIRADCKQRYPLLLAATEVSQGGNDMDEEEETNKEIDYGFIIHLMKSLDYNVLYNVVTNELKLSGLPTPDTIPLQADLNVQDHKELLTSLHQFLLETEIDSGTLTCPGCQRVYKIQQGIPNLRAREDEV